MHPGYKVYTILLNQTSTNAPVATEIKNEIGAIVWARTGAGRYTATLAGAFTANKTFIYPGSDEINNASLFAFKRTNNAIEMQSDYPGVSGANIILNASDGLIVNLPIEIRVYD